MIYAMDGTELATAYDYEGYEIEVAYNKAGSEVYKKHDPYIPGRTITFEDDFDGDSIDLTKWTYELGYGRNHELQQFWKRCVTVEDGSLVLTANKLDNTGTEYQSWESGSVNTQGLFSQTYGRFEAKIMFPQAAGAFPAFWFVGSSLVHYWQEGERWTSIGNWPACGEVDVVEIIPGNATTAQANLWDSSTTSANPISLGTGRSATYNPAEWHVYACEWTNEYMSMQLDGVEYKHYTWSDYTASRVSAYTGDEAMIIILNLSVGAAGGTPASDTTQMKMYVDWVRVYAPLS